jgi:polysaccharide export outer membrane protein
MHHIKNGLPMFSFARFRAVALVPTLAAFSIVFSGCAYIPTSGPSLKEVDTSAATGAIQLVDVDASVVQQLVTHRKQKLFSESLSPAVQSGYRVGAGDVIEVSIWEAPPATLFSTSTVDPRAQSATRAVTLTDLLVDGEGTIRIPFAGRVQASGQTLGAIEADIVKRLTGKANQPEVLVRLVKNTSLNATVVGEVANSLRFPLSPSGEKLLDAIAAAGGVRQSVNKITIQLTRGTEVFAMPLDTIIRDPRQNVSLIRGDVVTALYQTNSFNALGATGKNEEIPFEAQGISLAQALARSGGLQDSRSDARGVFIFRFEPKAALKWGSEPATTADDRVPVVYRIDLKNPNSFFVMQGFAINDKDLLYVSNAPAAELQKFLNVVFSVAYPLLNVVQITK